jgi:hypothetical protein
MDAPFAPASRTHDWQPCKITKGGLVCVCTVPGHEKLVHARLMGKTDSVFSTSRYGCAAVPNGVRREIRHSSYNDRSSPN